MYEVYCAGVEREPVYGWAVLVVEGGEVSYHSGAGEGTWQVGVGKNWAAFRAAAEALSSLGPWDTLYVWPSGLPSKVAFALGDVVPGDVVPFLSSDEVLLGALLCLLAPPSYPEPPRELLLYLWKAPDDRFPTVEVCDESVVLCAEALRIAREEAESLAERLQMSS